MSKLAKVNPDNSPEQVLHQYRKERHTDFIARTNQLDELAFKTSERYDQWVLTLAGGALAVSITFLEKIAPEPVPWTLWILALSWLSFIGSILAGFYAIHYSRAAIYRELDIARENYDLFISTSSTQNMQGEKPPTKDNLPRYRVEKSSKWSRGCLAVGTFFLCLFALINLAVAKNFKLRVSAEESAVKFYLPTSIISCIATNTSKATTMSKDTNKPLQGVTPPAPDGSIKGIQVGDPTTAVKGSYTPRQQDTPPPPPPPPPAKK